MLCGRVAIATEWLVGSEAQVIRGWTAVYRQGVDWVARHLGLLRIVILV